MIQIPKFIKDVTKYFQYEGSPNPTTQDDLQAFMKSDHSVIECLVDGLWQPETYYKEGHVVRSPNMMAGYNARVTVAGTSGTNEPDWGGATASDGTVTWKIQKQGSGGGGGASWEASTFYNVDSTVSLEGNSSFFLLCIKSGTSGATQPTVSGESNVTDGSVTWKPIYYKKLPTLDSSNYIKGENLAGYWKSKQSVTVDTIKFLHGDKYAGYYIKCTYAGTTGTTQPAPATTSTADFSDGTAKWQIKQISDAQALINASIGKYPSWYFDRGDGSDGAFNPSGATTISGVKNYTSVNIPSGVTVTVDKYAFIKCQGTFVNNGTITGNGKGVDGSETVDSNGGTSGYRCYSKKGDNGTGVGNAGAGGSGGLLGGLGSVINEAKLTREQFYDVLLGVFNGIGIGAGGASGQGYDGGGGNRRYGGKGGNGGAAIVIVSNSINNKGTIEVNGTNGAAGWGDSRAGGSGGGGAGGSIVGIANSIIDKGTTNVKGGESEGTYKGGTGEDGIVIWKELGV